MKIESSTVQMTGTHAATEKDTRKETLRAWIGERRPDFEKQGTAQQSARLDKVTLSPQAATQASQPVDATDTADTPENDLRMQILIKLVERLTGKKLQFVSSHALRLDDATRQQLETAQQNAQQAGAGAGTASQRAGWGVEYDASQTHTETETTRFSAEGVVRTQDGKEIHVSIDLAMSRQFSETHNISLRAGDARMKDPLVLNFNGNAAALTQTKFSFDLDADGSQEQISTLAPGSGFLAVDANGDGKINDGSELFGARSGNGFAELAAHDQDGNQWIDANDPIYDRLRIWSKDATGQDHLIALGEAGVGAIYLGNVATPFALKDAQNAQQGQIQSTGIYLGEDGTAGTVQKVDLAV
jgi:hypothetical protein